ncbi:MAG: nuclear transport factor 2 family protein [Acidobacteria bacterium]|nr:nuclear transport factor 2 family protein [Acidobacteriota bacterium]
MSRKYVFTLASLLVVAAIVYGYRGRGLASGLDKKADREMAAVRAVLEAQQAAWNRGDIDAFMEGYAKEETITFLSGDSFTRGWQTVLERYRKNYDSRAKMGTLAFSDLEFKPLSPFYTMVTGRFQLTRENGETPHGRFTLVFRRTTGGWRIVHDHTSTA